MLLARADLHKICNDAVEECRSAHPPTIVLETVGDATGSWDADRIEQALINSITNAIQYGGTSRSEYDPFRLGLDDRERSDLQEFLKSS